MNKFECANCKPSFIDSDNRVVPNNNPKMAAILRLWNTTTDEEREMFHRVCCEHSRNESDLDFIQIFANKLQVELEKL
jgi:hypothetical protein